MQFKTLFFAVTLSVLVSVAAPDLRADIIVTTRESRAFFDVFSGVGPDSNRRRETPPSEEGLTDPFAHSFTHSGSEMFDNGSISGRASANGDYEHSASIAWASNSLDVGYFADIQGAADIEGNGQAFADMTAALTLEFTVDESTNYSFDLVIGPQIGDAESRFVLRHRNTATNLHEIASLGQSSHNGVLAPGNYRLLMTSIGSDFNAELSMASNATLRFQAGVSSVPEPTSGVLLLLVLGSATMVRRRKYPVPSVLPCADDVLS